MPIYNVQIHEVYISYRTVEARDEEEAMNKAAMEEDAETCLEYGYSLGKEHWTAEKVQD